MGERKSVLAGYSAEIFNLVDELKQEAGAAGCPELGETEAEALFFRSRHLSLRLRDYLAKLNQAKAQGVGPLQTRPVLCLSQRG